MSALQEFLANQVLRDQLVIRGWLDNPDHQDMRGNPGPQGFHLKEIQETTVVNMNLELIVNLIINIFKGFPGIPGYRGRPGTPGRQVSISWF
jgi:hypothetical protein